MTFRTLLRQFAVTAYIAVVGFSIPAAAQEPVESILDALRTASPQDAQRLDRELMAAWSRSGSASMDLLLRRGREALEAEDLPAAIDHFTALTDHAPDFAEGWHGLARAYFSADRHGPALDALGRVMVLNPNQYHALFGLGVMFEQFGEPHRAYRAYSQVLDLNPHHEEAKDGLTRLRRLGIGRAL